jgi:hypothetical protein
MGVGKREAHWRHVIRTALHVPDEARDLKPVVHSEFCPTKGVRVERVSYGTQFGMRIPGSSICRIRCQRKRYPA